MSEVQQNKRYLFIAPMYHTNLVPMLKALRLHGHEVEIFTLHRLSQEDYIEFKPRVFGYAFLFRVFEKKNLIGNEFLRRFGFPPLFRFCGGMGKSGADVIVIRDITNVLSILSMIVGKWFLRKKIIVLLQVNDKTAIKKKKSIKLVQWFFGAKVVTPLYLKDWTLNKFSNLRVIPFPMPVYDVAREYFRDRKVNILSIGKYTSSKGQRVLLDAMGQLKSILGWRVTFVGTLVDEKYFQGLQEYAKELGISDRITWKQNVPWSEMKDVYLENDIFILSIRSVASVSVLEAMSYGLPVISSDGNGTHCYVEDGKNGFVFESNDVTDLAKKLESVLSDKERIRQMGKNAQSIVKNNHSMGVFYKCFNQLVG